MESVLQEIGGVNWEYFTQQLINGVTLGSIYGLIAIGYTMVYGIIGMINFAHGDIFMVGAFIALITIILLGLTVSAGLPCCCWRCCLVLAIAMIITLGLQLDGGAGGLSAAGVVSPGAADLGDRHVDRAAGIRAHQSGARPKPMPPLIVGNFR